MEESLTVEEIALINKKKEGKYLVEKYTPEKILHMLEKIQLIEVERENNRSAMSVSEFLRLFLKHMKFGEGERVYLAMGLVSLFKDVKDYEQKNQYGSLQPAQPQSDSATGTIKWESLTSYFIDNIIQGSRIENGLPNKYISKMTMERFKSVYDSSQLDRFTAEIVGGAGLSLRRFKQSQKVIDSLHHNQGIRNVDYAPSIGTIFVLDNITDKILLYNEHSFNYRAIVPKKENHFVDTCILFFSYSRTENRLGACLQDYTLAFWDASDDFAFEKTISAHLDVLQIYIKYVEFCTKWITIDQKNVLALWDIESEQYTPLPKRHEERITDTCEIVHLKLLAACSLDKLIILWDLMQKVPSQIIKLESISAHSMVYAQDFRVLVTAQYETCLGIWSFESSDCSLLTKLKGHNAQIASISMLKETPLLISADEIGFVKTWDIRSFQCIQTVHFECKSSIHQFVNISSRKFIGVEYRLHWFEFEEKPQINANGIEQLNMCPLAVEFNKVHNQLCILTKSDIRMVDMGNGQVVRILANILGGGRNGEEEEEGGKRKISGLEGDSNEITQFRLLQQGKKFIIGDNKGNMTTHIYQNGLVDTLNAGHKSDVTQIRMDLKSSLIVSAGWDSSLKVQTMMGQKLLEGVKVDKEGNFFNDKDQLSKTQVLRQVKNAHFSHEISHLQISLRLGMVATTSHGVIFLWDYELFRLVGSMSNEQNEVLLMEFLDPLPLLCSLDASGDLIIWESIQQQTQSFTIYYPQAVIRVGSSMRQDLGISSKMKHLFLNERDFQESAQPSDQGYQNFVQKAVSLMDEEQQFYSERKVMALLASDDFGQVYLFEIESVLGELLEGRGPEKKASNSKKSKGYYPMRNLLLKDNGIFQNEAQLILEQEKDRNKRAQEKPIPKPKVFVVLGEEKEQASLLGIKFKSASEGLNVLSLLNLTSKIIATSSNSTIVRLWSIFGEMLCVLDIDQPLPYRWRLNNSAFEQRKKKFLEAKQLLLSLYPLKRTQKKSTLLTELLSPRSSQLMRGEMDEEEAKQPLTFASFLSKVESENRVFKNPNKVSLKVMEARKKRESNDPLGSITKQKESNRKGMGEGGNERNQGLHAMTQFSLLDRIEAMVNAPKKFTDKTKEWDKALEDDIKKIKKIKNYAKEFTSEDLLANLPDPEEAKTKFYKAQPSDEADQKKVVLKRREHVGLRGLGDCQPITGNYSIIDGKPIPKASKDEHLITNESSIKRTLDKSVSSNGLMAFLNNDRNTSLNHSRTSKKLVDWQFYASIRQDPLSARNHLNQNATDESSLQNTRQSVNQYVEQRRMRTRLLNEMEVKRKFFNKPFQAASTELSYLQNVKQLEEQESTYEPPRFIRDLNHRSKQALSKKKGKVKQEMQSILKSDSAKEETLFLPKIFSSKILKTDRDL